MMTKTSRLRVLNKQIERLQRRLLRLQRRSYRYSWVRFSAFFVALLVTGLALYFVGPWLAAICLLAGALLFGAAIYAHGRLNWSIRQYQRWIQIKSAHIARAKLDWEQLPTGVHHRPETDHPFEADLDLVGRRSLHRLLDTAVSYEGSQRLRDWLAAPVPDLPQVTRRQETVRELAPRYLFRDKLALNAALAAGAQRTWKANQLIAWLEQGDDADSLRRWLILFGAFALLNALLFVANQLGLLPAWWQITLVLYLGLWLTRSRVIDAIGADALAIEGALRQLRAVLGHLETFSYDRTPYLKELCAPFLDPARRPSRYLGRITRIVAALGMRENPIFRFVLNALLPWDYFFAYRLSRTKADMARHAPAWMDVWSELEALSSLANFAFLNPSYSFPHFLAGQPEELDSVFQAEGLGHPLLSDGAKVCNDFAVSALGQVTIITGSNMAGKSVFLKTVGVNLALAQAGGPVNAQRLRTMPFRIFTCMGISDSVTDGFSFFYAEVRRLRSLLAELRREHPLPLLFCVDEIFRGTNNRERLIGSRAYVRALAGEHGLGLIATHDLELARLEGEASQVVNYHFRDHVVDGRMAFDYTLQAGPCPTTNALKIMELEGLPVPPQG
ncbi:MAG: hypothetical protein PVI80_05125 [Anaerolineae bacterium]